MKRLLVVLAGLIGIGIAGTFAVPAFAYEPPQPVYAYPPSAPEPAAEVNRGTVPEDGSVVFSGRAAPFEVLTITVTYRSSGKARNMGTATADGDGYWSIRLTLDQAGVAILKASGPSGTVTREVRVFREDGAALAATGMADGKLPTIVLTGAGSILLGALLVFGAVRWRRRTADLDA